MLKHYARFTLAWILGIGFLAILTACSPQKTVSKYSYLITERNPVQSELQKSVAPVLPVDIKEEVEEPSSIVVEEVASERPNRILRPENQEVIMVIETARSYLGTPYRYGGMSRLGVDCSGLMCLSYQAVNKALPRTSKAMADSGQKVEKEELEPGNLVFFDAKNGRDINHVGMVVAVADGEIEFIHASSSAGVRIDRLENPYWNKRFRRAVAP